MNSANVRFDSIRAAMIPGECVHEEKNEKTAPGILSPERFYVKKHILSCYPVNFYTGSISMDGAVRITC